MSDLGARRGSRKTGLLIGRVVPLCLPRPRALRRKTGLLIGRVVPRILLRLLGRPWKTSLLIGRVVPLGHVHAESVPEEDKPTDW